jgi:hypothetical protein
MLRNNNLNIFHGYCLVWNLRLMLESFNHMLCAETAGVSVRNQLGKLNDSLAYRSDRKVSTIVTSCRRDLGLIPRVKLRTILRGKQVHRLSIVSSPSSTFCFQNIITFQLLGA